MYSEEEMRILRAMTPMQKLKAAQQMYMTSRRLKLAALRALHPEWSEEQIQEALREAFLYARD